jgi:hypothetical protein
MILHGHDSYQLQKCKLEKAPHSQFSLLRHLAGLHICKHFNYLHILPLKNKDMEVFTTKFSLFPILLSKLQASLVVLIKVTEDFNILCINQFLTHFPLITSFIFMLETGQLY